MFQVGIITAGEQMAFEGRHHANQPGGEIIKIFWTGRDVVGLIVKCVKCKVSSGLELFRNSQQQTVSLISPSF